MTGIIELSKEWEKGELITRDQAVQIYAGLDEYLEHEFEHVAELAKQDPQLALSELVKMSNFLSAAANRVPGILSKLQKSIIKYQSQAYNIGRKLGANSLTISVGFPAGVAVSLTWSI